MPAAAPAERPPPLRLLPEVGGSEGEAEMEGVSVAVRDVLVDSSRSEAAVVDDDDGWVPPFLVVDLSSSSSSSSSFLDEEAVGFVLVRLPLFRTVRVMVSWTVSRSCRPLSVAELLLRAARAGLGGGEWNVRIVYWLREGLTAVVVDVINCADATSTPAAATVSRVSRVLAGFIDRSPFAPSFELGLG
jgi:hypothetical protein